MPKVSLADLLADWDTVLRGAARMKDQKRMRPHIEKLQVAYDRLRALQALREDLQAQQQQATQQMGEVKEAGKIAAVEVRSMAKGILGPSNARLVELKIRPIRPRGPRRKPTTESPPKS